MTFTPADPRPSEASSAAAGDSYEPIKWLKRAQWIRAAILGENDGLMSTTALMLGVGAAKDDRWSMIVSGVAGALAGASSMAAGEFVSVSTQRDIEKRLTRSPVSSVLQEIEVTELVKDDEAETKVTAAVKSPGNEKEIIRSDEVLPNPYKAAVASGLAFLCGSSVPLVPATFVREHAMRVMMVVVVASFGLAVFGGLGARLGGSDVKLSAVRVLVGGWMAMGITYGLLKPFDTDKD